MVESIVLDILLIVVVALLGAVGVYRGGMREAFSAAGVVLGVLLAEEWGTPCGTQLAENSSLSPGGAVFVVSVGLLVLATALVGYGVGASFNYHPGPGGRMFGAALGVVSGLVAMAYVITWLRDYVFDGDEPAVVAGAYLARLLDGGQGVVLLVASGGLALAAVFGSFVRERDDEHAAVPQQPGVRRVAPEKVEPARTEPAPTAPVRVVQGRQWEDRAGSMPESGRQWSNTWPSDAPGVPQEERAPRPSDVQQARERRRRQRQDRGDDQRGGSR